MTDNLDRFVNNSVDEYAGLSTYQYWKHEFGLSCRVSDHRYFFHWGYQRLPWSDDLLQFLPDSVVRNPNRLSEFRDAVRKEQQRRNQLTNAATEHILGFDSTGFQARYANAFVAIIYDVHLLGDYEGGSPEGLAPVNAVIAELNNNIREIDRDHSSWLVKKLQGLGRETLSDQEKALKVLQCLRDNLPRFIYEADDGRVNMREHFIRLGFTFKSSFADPNSQGTAANDADKQQIVLVTRSGKYHIPGCENLGKAKDPKEMTINAAKAKGYPAAKCCFKQ